MQTETRICFPKCVRNADRGRVKVGEPMGLSIEHIEAIEDEAMEEAIREIEQEPIKNFVPPMVEDEKPEQEGVV